MLPLKKILCPSDFSETAQKALDEAVELALLVKAELVIVHVVPVLPPAPSDPNVSFAVPEYERALHHEAEQRLHAMAAEISGKGLTVHTAVGHGDAGTEIVRIAREEGVDLIVIGTHGTTGWQHVLFGSVAEKVVRLAQRRVLVIPAPRE